MWIQGAIWPLDYGQELLEDSSIVHFIALELRRSRFLYVQPQDHPFTAEESVAAIYNFMVRIGGRFKMLVIDQDRCLVYEQKYGEITPLSCPYNINSVDKLAYITYLSNKYSVLKILRNTKLRTKV